jgi:hypothetical protein
MPIIEADMQHQQKKVSLLRHIESMLPFRQGSLEKRFRKCGKPNCHCAQPGSPGHGPIWVLTRKVKGKTVTKTIREDAVEATMKQIAEFHRFQEVVQEYVETNIQICDELLEESKDDLKEAEKGGSKQP